MAANFLNTNRNADRFFFATTENGEQTLGLNFGTTGGVPNLSTMSVSLSGGGGVVIVNEAPQFIATEFVIGERALITGTDSTYFTMSTLTSSILGVNISTDRIPGSGIACIESYAGNGAFGGFEFLSRGLGSQLLSTSQNALLSTFGSPGGTAVLTASGDFVCPQLYAANAEVTTVNSYSYPQALLSTNFTGSAGALCASNTPAVIYSLASAATSNMVAGRNYLVDIPANIVTGAPGGSGAFVDIGVRLGGDAVFSYATAAFIPPGGTPGGSGISMGFTQIATMGTLNKNIEIIANLQGVSSLSISTAQIAGGQIGFMKEIT